MLRLKQLSLVSTLVSLIVGLSSPVLAQQAEVPAPDANGNYTTALWQGNRGDYFQNRQWLVVDPEPTYLNCRDTPNGTVRARIAPGAILTASFSRRGRRDAIVMHHGSPWLRVDAQGSLVVGETGICYVRAHQRYIAPINEEALHELLDN